MLLWCFWPDISVPPRPLPAMVRTAWFLAFASASRSKLQWSTFENKGIHQTIWLSLWNMLDTMRFWRPNVFSSLILKSLEKHIKKKQRPSWKMQLRYPQFEPGPNRGTIHGNVFASPSVRKPHLRSYSFCWRFKGPLVVQQFNLAFLFIPRLSGEGC